MDCDEMDLYFYECLSALNIAIAKIAEFVEQEGDLELKVGTVEIPECLN